MGEYEGVVWRAGVTCNTSPHISGFPVCADDITLKHHKRVNSYIIDSLRKWVNWELVFFSRASINTNFLYSVYCCSFTGDYCCVTVGRYRSVRTSILVAIQIFTHYTENESTHFHY